MANFNLGYLKKSVFPRYLEEAKGSLSRTLASFKLVHWKRVSANYMFMLVGIQSS